MIHTIKIPENDLKKLIAKHFTNCDPNDIYFSFDEGQLGDKIVYAMITVREEI